MSTKTHINRGDGWTACHIDSIAASVSDCAPCNKQLAKLIDAVLLVLALDKREKIIHPTTGTIVPTEDLVKLAPKSREQLVRAVRSFTSTEAKLAAALRDAEERERG